ncbi:C-GCAxxG-C-C family protein [Bacteroidota bacterium]
MEKKKFKRRGFIKGSTLIAGGLFIGACSGDKDSGKDWEESKSPSKGLSRETIMKQLDQRVDSHMNRSHHCAQTAFKSLAQQFGFENDAIMKALTPMPGIGERGETCGAITGSLMALGMVYGRDKLDDWETYRASLIPANKLCQRFEEFFGSTMCGEIVECEFGKRYDLMDPEDQAEFQAAGATIICSEVVRTAVQIAAELILEKEHSS